MIDRTPRESNSNPKKRQVTASSTQKVTLTKNSLSSKAVHPASKSNLPVSSLALSLEDKRSSSAQIKSKSVSNPNNASSNPLHPSSSRNTPPHSSSSSHTSHGKLRLDNTKSSLANSLKEGQVSRGSGGGNGQGRGDPAKSNKKQDKGKQGRKGKGGAQQEVRKNSPASDQANN